MIKISKLTLFYTVFILLSVVNLLTMHYTIGRYTEVPFDVTSYVDNFSCIILDILIIFCTFMLLFNGRIKLSLLFCTISITIWAFSNILYSRFFFQYISISSIGQVGNLLNISMLKCIIEGLRWTDLFFLVSISLSLIIYYNITSTTVGKKKIFLYFFSGILVVFTLIVSSTVFISINNPGMNNLGYIKHHLITHHLDLYRNSANPNWTHFHRGSIWTILQPQIFHLFSSQKLTSQQIYIIEKKAKDQRMKRTDMVSPNVDNVIFIFVESYLSLTSDLIVNGKEITPNLNKLKRDSNVFYNGKIVSNITIGESGDGQFICMTGLLPLRSEITVGRAKNITLPGLPKILSQHLNVNTRMLIPTTPSMWEQEKMCQQYGITKLYSCTDYNQGKGDLNDQQTFQHLKELDEKSTQPFFSIVLTMSMHQPYTNTTDPSFQIADSNLSKEYINYLNACHYTDRQIGEYLNFLKSNGIYEKSLIIITGDHHPNPNSLKMEGLSYNIPVYIINANINKEKAWNGECNQLDIYTTILDILVKDSLNWRGLGNSILTTQYKNSLTNNTWNISEWIIHSDYFKLKKNETTSIIP